MKNFVSFILVALTALSLGQSPFTDGRGKSSLVLPGSGGFAQVEFDKTSAKVGYLRDISGRPDFWGIELSAKLSGDTATLFSNNQLKPDASFKLTLGRRLLTFADLLAAARIRMPNGTYPDPSSPEYAEQKAALVAALVKASNKGYPWVALQIEGRAAQYRMYDSTAAFGSQITKQSFEGGSIHGLYNILLPNRLYGVSIGIERGNNVDDLDEISITDRTTVVSGGVSRIIDQTVKAYDGTFKKVDRAPAGFDAVWWPDGNSRVAFSVFARDDLRDASASFVPGLGAFLVQQGAPTNVIGGVTLSFKKGKPTAQIVAGYSF
jgi:hypothetical protein